MVSCERTLGDGDEISVTKEPDPDKKRRERMDFCRSFGGLVLLNGAKEKNCAARTSAMAEGVGL